MIITPVGKKLLVSPVSKEHHTTESGIIAVENSLAYAKVEAVSKELSKLFKKGDVVIYPEKTGVNQMYNGLECLWLNDYDVWGIEEEQKTKKTKANESHEFENTL
jgi:co-chaperonin GroES (HSP10)